MAELSPPARVVGAMPGTLAELSVRTGYPPAEVLRQITNARREGMRVNAVEDGISRNGGRRVDPEWGATTVYEVPA